MKTIKSALAIGSLLITNAVVAVDLTADFRTGYGTSDNIARTSIGEIDEDFAFVGTTILMSEQTARFGANVRLSADYLDYLDDTFEDQVIGGFLADINYAFIPERFTLRLTNSYGQRLLDPLARPSPGNRENVNNFTTSFDFRQPLGIRNFLGATARYRNVMLEESSQFDSERVTGLFRIGRQITSDTTVSLNVSKEQTSFDNGGLSDDFDVTNAFIRYEVASVRNLITADVGYSDLETDAGEGGTGYLVQMAWTRTISESSTFMSGVGSRYSDQGDIFAFSQDISTDIGETVDTDGDDSPFRNNYLFARYDATMSLTRINLLALWSQDEFELGGFGDRDTLAMSALIRRDLTAKTFASVGARYSKRDFKFIDQRDDQIDLIASVGYRLTRAFDLSLSFLRVDRTSNIPDQEFVENRVVLQLNFTPSWGRQTLATGN